MFARLGPRLLSFQLRLLMSKMDQATLTISLGYIRNVLASAIVVEWKILCDATNVLRRETYALFRTWITSDRSYQRLPVVVPFFPVLLRDAMVVAILQRTPKAHLG